MVSGKETGQTAHPSGPLSLEKRSMSSNQMTVSSTWPSKTTLSATEPLRFPWSTTNKNSSTLPYYTTSQMINSHFLVSRLKKISISMIWSFPSICTNRATGLAAIEKTWQLVRSLTRVSTAWWSWMIRACFWRDTGATTGNSKSLWRWHRVRCRQAATQSWLTQVGTHLLILAEISSRF